ncbi:8-amino-7-oxononanoate synthase [Reinekea sp.]|uniref:8-amino-7-oxononanoate synthase n=1 Tax=Reinekea sp. TaxID=1970455 RepID=UPI003989B688
MKNFSDIAGLLAQRKNNQLYRSRIELQSAQSVRVIVDGTPMLSFCSNDYLGLANHPKIAQAMTAAIEKYGVGSGASHLVDGHHREHELLEQELAVFTGREKTLLFSTGYMANVGVISALLSRHDSVIQDKLNHASLIDGGILSQAKLKRYRHNDVGHLAQQLERADGKKLVVTDGVFSMDGDCAPLSAIAELCQQHDAWLLVDDAHGFGTLGETGAGLVSQLNLTSQQVPLLIGTLGKAFGTSGAFVTGDTDTLDYLMQFARPYIYTTATPPSIAAATRASLKLVIAGEAKRAQLNANIAHFRAGVSQLGYELMRSNTAIQPIIVGSNERALSMSAKLKAKGLLVTAIRPPTVPVGTARLRITLSAEHTKTDVDELLSALEAIQ